MNRGGGEGERVQGFGRISRKLCIKVFKDKIPIILRGVILIVYYYE